MSVFLSVASPFPQVFFAVFFYSCWLKVTQFTASSYLPLLKEKVPFFGRSVGWSSSSYFSRPFLPLLSFFFCCLCCKSSRRYQDKLLSLSLSFFFSGHYHFHPRNFIFPFKVEKRNKGEEGGGSSSSFRTRINHLTLVPLES